MINTFINKIINDWQNHFKKPGNQTLGSLPNLWELELKEMLEDAFNAGREYSTYYKYEDFDDYLKTKENDK